MLLFMTKKTWFSNANPDFEPKLDSLRITTTDIVESIVKKHAPRIPNKSMFIFTLNALTRV